MIDRPLALNERLFALSGRVDPFNISAVVSIECADLDAVLSAAREVLYPIRVALDTSRKAWRPSTIPPSVSVSDKRPDQLLTEGLVYRFDEGATPMACWAVLAPAGRVDVVLVVDHTLCDAVCLLRLFYAIAERVGGEPIVTFRPPPGTRNRTAPPLPGVIPTLRRDFGRQMRYRLGRQHRPKAATDPSAAHVEYCLEAALIKKVQSAARRQGLTLNAVVQAAHIEALRQVFSLDGTVLGMTFSNLRSVYGPPFEDTELGAHVGLIPYVGPSSSLSFWTLAKMIQVQAIGDFRDHSDIARQRLLSLMMPAMQRWGRERLCDLAISWSGRLPKAKARVGVGDVRAFISPTRLGPLWGVWAARRQSGVHCCAAYLTEHLDLSMAQRMAGSTVDHLESALRHD